MFKNGDPVSISAKTILYNEIDFDQQQHNFKNYKIFLNVTSFKCSNIVG